MVPHPAVELFIAHLVRLQQPPHTQSQQPVSDKGGGKASKAAQRSSFPGYTARTAVAIMAGDIACKVA